MSNQLSKYYLIPASLFERIRNNVNDHDLNTIKHVTKKKILKQTKKLNTNDQQKWLQTRVNPLALAGKEHEMQKLFFKKFNKFDNKRNLIAHTKFIPPKNENVNDDDDDDVNENASEIYATPNQSLINPYEGSSADYKFSKINEALQNKNQSTPMNKNIRQSRADDDADDEDLDLDSFFSENGLDMTNNTQNISMLGDNTIRQNQLSDTPIFKRTRSKMALEQKKKLREKFKSSKLQQNIFKIKEGEMVVGKKRQSDKRFRAFYSPITKKSKLSTSVKWEKY